MLERTLAERWIRRAVLITVALSSMVACDGATFRCDPSPSWSVGRSDGGADDAAADEICGGECTAIELALGDRHTCAAVGAYSEVVCFGANEQGQSSPRVDADETLPVAVHQRTSPFADMLGAGAISTCSIFDGAVVCWGSGAVLGGNASDPPRTIVEADAFEVRHAALHIGVHRDLGSSRWAVFGAWNGIDAGAPAPLDQPETWDHARELFVGVGGFSTWSFGWRETTGEVVLYERGRSHDSGPFRAGSSLDRRETPNEPYVDPLLECDGCQLAAGLLHACARKTGETILCRGHNDRGQLGRGRADGEWHDAFDGAVVTADGAAQTAFSELCVGGYADIEVDGTEITVGETHGGHSCARSEEGEVWCWGANDRGQLGDGAVVDRAFAARVVGLPPAADIECGGEHTCAITEEGELWCWGDNRFGQLGVPSIELEMRALPARVDLTPRETR